MVQIPVLYTITDFAPTVGAGSPYRCKAANGKTLQTVGFSNLKMKNCVIFITVAQDPSRVAKARPLALVPQEGRSSHLHG